MAYRFLLEVPETLAAEAQTAVAATPDAQVLVVRDSHGLGFEDPFVDLTVAAHSLHVIDGLYDWFDLLGASRPDVRLVLHNGERVALEAADRGDMVAAIRRDQPWVERTLPKVGEHEEDDIPVAIAADRAIDGAGGNAPTAVAARHGKAPAEIDRRIRLRQVNHIAVMVNDPAKAESFYGQLLNMELVGRARLTPSGIEPVETEFGWDAAIKDGKPADVTFLSNGPLTLAIHRAGRGARLDPGVVDHISVAVDGAAFATIKGEALVRPLTLTASSERAFRFRDPFGLSWEITLEAGSGFPGR